MRGGGAPAPEGADDFGSRLRAIVDAGLAVETDRKSREARTNEAVGYLQRISKATHARRRARAGTRGSGRVEDGGW